jgi:hypothetical protein
MPNTSRDALETAREYNLNVGVGGDNRKKENSEWFKRNDYIFTQSCTRTNLII